MAAGTRALGGCRVPPLLITPLPRQSLLAPGVPPHTPNRGKRPAATPGRLHFASALQRGRRSASTKGGWPGRAGYTASGPGGGGGPGRGTAGPSSRAPNRVLLADSGPTGWLLAANVIWGRLGGNPPPSKIDPGWTAAAANRDPGWGRTRPRPGPFPSLCAPEAGRRGNAVRGVTGARSRPRMLRARGAQRPSASARGSRRPESAAAPSPPGRPAARASSPAPQRRARLQLLLPSGCFLAPPALRPTGKPPCGASQPAETPGAPTDIPALLPALGAGTEPSLPCSRNGSSPRASARFCVLLSKWLSPGGTGLNMKSQP